MTWLSLDSFPLLNCSLNTASASLLLAGFIFIKTGRYKAHAASLIAAFCASTVFLTCYVIYHAQRAPKSLGLPMSTFTVVYYTILFSHMILAVIILPLILITFWRAYKRVWDRHRKIAVITMPLWFYVSVTGVVIYFMLYHHPTRSVPEVSRPDGHLQHAAESTAGKFKTHHGVVNNPA